MADSDTIAALATAPGDAGIAITRISGPDALAIADRVFSGRVRPSEAAGGRFFHGRIRGETSDAVDEVLLLVFRAPHSYTAEDVIEIQGHGGRAAAQHVLRVVLQAGARLAEPGEFTRRAFLNGRLDLVQAEAVADLIRAQSDRAASIALHQLSGDLSCCITNIYSDIISIDADLEATLDFSEDERLPSRTLDDLISRLEAVRQSVLALLATWREGHLLREGATIAIAGAPNVGKSTLMNALLQRERSIVTPVPGTTRDLIEEQLVIDGVVLRILDTAGLRQADCIVEQEGIRRAESARRTADLVLYVVDGSNTLQGEDRQRILQHAPDRTVIIINKSDLGLRLLRDQLPDGYPTLTVSLIKKSEVDIIKRFISETFSNLFSEVPHACISERHRAALEFTDTQLQQAMRTLKTSRESGSVLAAEHLRSGLLSLGGIIGREFDTELLNTIFSRFCIGK